jgi:hypothetical protein
MDRKNNKIWEWVVCGWMDGIDGMDGWMHLK